jgi:hypothetical protein
VKAARTKVIERLFAGHFFAYPIAVVWAAASIPLAIHLFIHEIDQLEGKEAIGQLVVHRVAWPAGAAFVLVHVSAGLWAFAGDPAVGFRRFIRAIAGIAIVGAVFGAASWGWLMLR